MAEHDDERECRRRYRELPREEPPAALDEAIRARARAAAGPVGRRWYVPVAAAAAVLGLAVGVALQVERKSPDAVLAQAPAPQEAPARRSEAPRGLMSKQAESPPQWLERIARLRAEGRHAQADKALVEFRERHPDFRIPPQTLERVERK